MKELVVITKNIEDAERISMISQMKIDYKVLINEELNFHHVFAWAGLEYS